VVRGGAVTLPTELDALYTEHRQCAEPEAGVDGLIVWIVCVRGAKTTRRVPKHKMLPLTGEMDSTPLNRARRACPLSISARNAR
jgi:hypothetical protein